VLPFDPSCRCKFGFRARFRLSRRGRGFLPLRRQLFHRRLSRLGPRALVAQLEEELAVLPAERPVTLDEMLGGGEEAERCL
jgi:hypothetical protein